MALRNLHFRFKAVSICDLYNNSALQIPDGKNMDNVLYDI